MSSRRLRWVPGLLVLSAGAAFLAVARQDFFVASGSDVLMTVFRPPLWAQALGVVVASTLVFQACIPADTKARRAGLRAPGIRALLVVLAGLVLALSFHFLAIDGLRGEIVDVWFLWKVQRLSFDLVEGPGASIRLQEGWFRLGFDNNAGEEMSVVVGVSPWRLDKARVKERIFGER